MCLPKCEGGFGFKDLALFNQTLLAKQAWRIFSVPDSLAARVLKAKYFSSGDFMSASTKAGCSHIWRSLNWGRELLSKGLRWNVGDGSKINVFKDTSFKLVTFDPGTDLRVSDLFDRARRDWNVDILDQILLSIDKEVVLSIPINWMGGQDFQSLHFDKKGEYTVSSGYKCALQDSIKEAASPSFQAVFQTLADKFDPDELSSACMLAWAAWEDRNSLINTGKAKDPNRVASRALEMLVEFKNSMQAISSPPTIPTFRAPTDWVVPPPSRLKLNTCATFLR
ncbi:hypothetical protein Ddye_032162 [Dipteronia dyeriana]|uniref:Reverse transcriptase n=1 Tax=Dipteronia dyeriana TaxID=168575 RepID=A0AAD9TJN0_9ROSI|nr:hypothetical protein Ddye_032162 [Dipteronia dyeriana]